MDWWIFTFIIGAILSLFSPVVPALFYVIFLMLVGILLIRFKSTLNSSGLLFGMAWLLYCGSLYQNTWQNNGFNQKILHQQKHIIQGEVLTIPTINNSSQRFNFSVNKIDNIPLKQPIYIRLSWEHGSAVILQGQKWQLNVKIKPAHGLANTGGFSYETWLRYKNIVASGYVINTTSKTKTKTKTKSAKPELNILLSKQTTLRQQLFSQSKKLVTSEPLSALLFALSFGERTDISPEMWKVLQKTSTQHLIAISGLHLGLMAAMSFYLSLSILRFLPLNKVMSPRVKEYTSGINLNVIAILISLIITGFYAYLAGFSLPTVRALIMLVLYWGARISGIRFSIKRGLLIAIFAVVLLFPFSLFSVSFWLSFYAVSIIFLVLWRFSTLFKQQGKVKSWLLSLVVVQLAFSIFMLPVVSLVNPQFSLVALFANIIAVPLMSFTAIPLCLMAVVFLSINEHISAYLFDAAIFFLELLWQWLSYLSALPWAVVTLSNHYIIGLSLVITLIFIWLFLSPTKKVFIQISGAFICAACGYVYLNERPHYWQVSVMDVGQGLAVIVEKNGSAILYDTGASYPSGFNMVEAVIIPYLATKGIKTLDKVIISHSDNDHAGGLDKLNSLININELIVNDEKHRPNNYCQYGKVFYWQNLTFSMLWPNQLVGEHNDDSCVIKISDGYHSVLLTGDISTKIERKLLKQHNEKIIDISATVLIAPHHGSKTSSSIDFIKTVSPELVVFSAGHLNRWHMPVKEIVERYEDQGVTHLNTAVSGMIRIDINTNGIEIKKYRRHLWPYWFAN